jgi:oxygen-dependent protoporphyrinogen oxidase
MADVIVIGGGIAGLAAAYELNRLGASFLLLEARPRLGGVLFGEQIDDFTIDAGPDSILVQKPDGVALCQELGLGGRLIPTKLPRVAFVQRHGRLHALPASSVLGIPTALGPLLQSSLFSWSGKLRMVMERLAPARRDEADESIGAFMRRRFGSEATTYVAEPLLAGIHAGDVDRLSVTALFPRLRDLEKRHGSVSRGLRAGEPDTPASSTHEGGVFRSLPGGLIELVHALVAALPPDVLRHSTAATRVARFTESDRAIGLRDAGTSRLFRVETSGAFHDAQSIILATPAFVTARVLRELDSELASLCDRIPYASTATVALAFERSAVSHHLAGTGFVVPRTEDTRIFAASWLSSKWPHRAPESKVLLRTFVGGARDPRALDYSDEQLIARSMESLAPLLGITARPLLSRVYRWERANVQYEVGHVTVVSAIEAALARHRGLYVTGSGFRGVGIPDCIADARRTAALAAAAVSGA